VSIWVFTQSGISSSRPFAAVSPSNGAPISTMSKSTVPVAIDCCRRAL
jgi:hypothetical protein